MSWKITLCVALHMAQVAMPIIARTWILPVARGTSNCRRIKHPIKASQGTSTREYKKGRAARYIIAPINVWSICWIFLTLLFLVAAARIYSAFEMPSDRHELPINFLYILNLMLHIMFSLLADNARTLWLYAFCSNQIAWFTAPQHVNFGNFERKRRGSSLLD